jgi:glycosyltransferase involved in cell wall biosynthesis
MRLLFVGMPESIHTARWIAQIQNQGWEIYLFPVSTQRPHTLINNIYYFNSNPLHPLGKRNNFHSINWPFPFFYLDYLRERLHRNSPFRWRELALSWAIRQLKPDLIHSLEFQHAAYMTYGAIKMLQKRPPWYVSNWGSDIFLFGRLPSDRQRVMDVLQSCDYYSCECERDVSLARDLGLRGKVMPVLPNAGGIDIEDAMRFRKAGLPSERRTIVIKGYQHWAGRALVAIKALRSCVDLLDGYIINIYSASPEVEIAAELFSQDSGITINLIPQTSHEEMLKLYGLARIYIGLSISDGISTSLLEAMIMGAFPIQSHGACANEWFENKIGGFIVDPDDPQIVAGAIRFAIKDDGLINRAALINEEVVRQRLDQAVIRPQVIKTYREILSISR